MIFGSGITSNTKIVFPARVWWCEWQSSFEDSIERVPFIGNTVWRARVDDQNEIYHGAGWSRSMQSRTASLILGPWQSTR